jgi:SPOR domain
MADRNQLKKAVPSNQINDDPFAELTRIMGFDPRVPVSRSQPAAVEKLAALAAEEDDFSIDLEKELMGGLDDGLEARAHVASKPLVEPKAVKEDTLGEDEDTLSEDFDFVFDADPAAREHDPVIAAAADKALVDELDAAFGAEPVFDESGAAEMRAETIAGEISVDEPVAAVETEEAPTDEFETALAAEMAKEPPVEAVKEEPPVSELETAFAQEPVAEEYDAASDAAEEEILADEIGEEFATHFEDHLAANAAEEQTDIEPEMPAEPELAEAEMQASGEQAAEPVAETYDDAEDAPLIPLGAAREFARTNESLAADFDAAAVEMTQMFDEPPAQAGETDDDYDLEAELSALLGKSAAASTSSMAAVAPTIEFEPTDEALAPVVELASELEASPDDDWAVDSDDPLPLAAQAYEREPIVDEETPASHTELQPEEPVAAESSRDDADQDHYEEPELDRPTYASAAKAAHQDEAAYEEEVDPLSEFVLEQELQAELAALESDIDLAIDDLVPTDEQPAYAAAREDRHWSNEPVSVDEPVIETTAKDGTVAGEMTDCPVDEQPAPVVSSAHAPVHKAHEPLPVEEEDPFAMLAAMVRQTPIAPSASFTAPTGLNHQDRPRSDAPIANESPAVPTNAYQYQYQNRSYTNRAPVSAPDIETVDVPESAVALADDLDIPDVAFEDEVPLAADFDDFEAELAAAFNQQTSAPAQPVAVPARAAPHTYQHEHAQYQQPAAPTPGYIGGAAATTVAAQPAYAATQTAAHAGLDDGRADLDRAVTAGDQARGDHNAMDDDDLAYDPEMNEDMAIPAYHDAAERHASGSRRGLWIAAVVGGVVLVGGIGAYALSGGAGADAPALVRADTDPVKVRPENPGGTTVPNQDNKVFQTMNGTDTTAAAPTQEKLISGTEEPVDVATRAESQAITPQSAEEGEEAIEDAPLMADDGEAMAEDPIAAEIAAAPKGEDRVAPDAEGPAANNETLAVAPRRVRTMVVRSDGTLVPSEEPAPVAAQPQADDTSTTSALEPADPAKSLSDPVAPESTGSLKPSDAAPAEMAAAQVPAETAAVTAPAKPAAVPTPAAPATQSGTPDSGPVAPSRPADQPVDVVGEVKPQRVAAASGAAAAGGWSMQIASQPSEAAAKSSYEDLARRYGSVIGGRDVNIVKADIAGKGTFWRVRVSAGSRNEAISLCESYKAAGGNCFVSK